MARRTKKDTTPKPRIAATQATLMGSQGATPLGQQIERAMIEATEQAMAEGVSDPVEILKRKLAARERVVAAATGG